MSCTKMSDWLSLNWLTRLLVTSPLTPPSACQKTSFVAFGFFAVFGVGATVGAAAAAVVGAVVAAPAARAVVALAAAGVVPPDAAEAAAVVGAVVAAAVAP